MTDHQHEPRPGTLRDWAGWHRAEEDPADYPVNATCAECGQPITKPSAGAAWVPGEDQGAAPAADKPTDLHPGERVHTNYELPGTHPVLVLGLTTRGRLLWGTRKGTGWAYSPEWTGMITVGIGQWQEVLEQIRTDQDRDKRRTWPSELRLALRKTLSGGPATLRFVESSHPAIDRRDLIAELAAMRGDGEVTFQGPRYVLAQPVDRSTG